MGKIIYLQEFDDKKWYPYELPEVPRKEDILFSDLPKKDQYWRIPPRLDFKRASQSEKVEYIRQERDRWLNGVWFMNNGVPTYITGMHYDHMVYMTFEFGKAKYFDQQRLDFYMRDLSRKDKQCFGVCWFKPRRYGMTAEELTNAVYVSMEDFNRFVGLMSNEGKKAVTTLMRPIIDAIVKRPKFMRPDYYKPSGKKPRVSIEFHDGNIDYDDEGMIDEFACLNGNIFPYNTTPAAMDAKKEHYIVMDEVWKWTAASPGETLGINKKCVEDFGISGKISMLSTMGDSDDYKQAIKEGIKIGDDSNPDVRDLNGRTMSGLYRYFVSAVHSKILPPEFTDIYGFVDVEKATRFIMNDRAKYDENSKEYIFEVRRMPLSYEEAVMSAMTGTTFDNKRLVKRKTALAALPREKKPYVIGFLEDLPNGDVAFRPDNNGWWKVSILPYVSSENNINTRNCCRKVGSRYKPPKKQEFCFGYDPVRYADKSNDDAKVSKASIIVKKKFDYWGGGNEGKYAALFVRRLANPHDMHKEAIKAAKFWGMAGMHERNVEVVEEDFEEAGCYDLLMTYSKDGKKGIYTDGRKNVVKTGVDMIVASMRVDPDTGYDPVQDIPFEEIIIDRMEFDPKDTHTSDVTMSDIMNEFGMKQMVYINAPDNDEEAKRKRHILMPKRAA